VQAWIELHRDELIADWEFAVNGEEPYKITPQGGLVYIGTQKLPDHYLIIAFIYAGNLSILWNYHSDVLN